MAVDAAMVKQVRQYAAEAEAAGYEPDIEHLRPLVTIAELFAYMFEVERREGNEELGVDYVELLIQVCDVDRDRIRESEAVLRELGYAALCARLRKLARKAPSQPRASDRWRDRLCNTADLG